MDDVRPFLKALFGAVSPAPLDPDDQRYVPLYSSSGPDYDPVELLARAIEWSDESVQLFSGYRGAGKSTELRRLKAKLEEEGHAVFLIDMEDYLNMSSPVDVSDFLLAVAGSFGEAVGEKLGDAVHEPLWEKLRDLLRGRKFELTEVTALGLKAGLKQDPSFKEQLQQHMAGHLGAFVQEVQAFLQGRVEALRANGCRHQVVLLLDSIEHLRGTLANAGEVHASLENLFAAQADKLQLPDMHVVYTVPPYLKVRHQNIGTYYEPGGLNVLPTFKIQTPDGQRLADRFDVMEQVVSKRTDWRRLLGDDRTTLDRLVAASGGHLRDLMRLLREVALRAGNLPVSSKAVDDAINQVRGEFLPIADDELLWLEEIALSHQIALHATSGLPTLARFFDAHLVLSYRNDEDWYDVHPLVRDYVLSHADQARKRTAD